MAKADITLPNGTHVVVDGTAEEVEKIIKTITNEPRKELLNDKNNKSKSKRRKPGLTSYVLELKETNYFSKQRSLEDILNALKQKGHIYPITSLSETMLRLTKQKDVGRIRENGKWLYVQR